MKQMLKNTTPSAETEGVGRDDLLLFFEQFLNTVRYFCGLELLTSGPFPEKRGIGTDINIEI